MKKTLLFLTFYFSTVLAFCQETDWCDKLIRNVDEFTDKIEISTPLNINPSITKYVHSNGKTEYYLYITAKDSYCSVGGTGLIILFKDGTKFKKPNAKIETNYYGYGDDYTYSAFIKLSLKEVKLFSEKEITKFRLEIFDETINETDAITFKSTAKCLINTK